MLPSIKCPIMRHVMRPLMRRLAVGSSGAGVVERLGWRTGRAVRGIVERSGVPGRKDRAAAGGAWRALVATRQIGAAPVLPVGRIGRRAGSQVQRPVAARPGSCQARWPQARPARRRQALSTLTLCGLDPVDPTTDRPSAWKDPARSAGAFVIALVRWRLGASSRQPIRRPWRRSFPSAPLARFPVAPPHGRPWPVRPVG